MRPRGRIRGALQALCGHRGASRHRTKNGFCTQIGHAPASRRASELKRRFDAIFSTETGFATLDRLLARLRVQKDELLMVLKPPEIPPYQRLGERYPLPVIRRKISAGTPFDAGRNAHDAFLGLMKTCAKHAISFWEYLGGRFGVPEAPSVARLAELLRAPA